MNTTVSEQALILNVDDNDAGRYAKTRTLMHYGFRVIEAATGEEALERVRTQAPELVLLDVNLPDISGLEVCRRLKEDTATQSILILETSASSVSTYDKVRALDHGADNYLFEPVSAAELIANVNALLRLGRAERELRAMTLKLTYLAHHDFLTDLPNRILLNDRIMQAISSADRHGTGFAVLFLDLDHFKFINDSAGHEFGDKLLQSVTERLKKCVRNSDTVSRQGGDEFVILLTEVKHGSAAVTAEKILHALAAPHLINGQRLHITTSIGISVYPGDGGDAETMIKSADIAMYHSKDMGRNTYHFFSEKMNAAAAERQFIEASLRCALEREEFVLHYQPKVNLETGRISGAEALLRWMPLTSEAILPDRFIPIAEESGLIVPIGQWVLREACMQAKRWEDAGLLLGSIAVNISALEFRQRGFLEGVRAILNDTGLEAHRLQLEITESVLMRDAKASVEILESLKAMGVQLAMDDFGTGYSSLSYLKRFPIDVLKIDQSFVHDIGTATNDGIIVSAMIGMGSSLKQQVVAEGVENELQLGFLKARHCDQGQGYLFSRPLVATDFAVLLRREAMGNASPS